MSNNTIRGLSPYADFQHADLVRSSRLAAIVNGAASKGHKVRHDIAEALAMELEYLALNFDLVPKK